MSLSPTQINAFRDTGILVIDSGIPESTLDGILTDLDAMPAKQLEKYRNGRMPDAWLYCSNGLAAAVHAPILEQLQQLYGAVPRPFQTLNFPVGTQQRAHADSIHFNSEPFGMMCGVWLALEDIGPEQGPLIYYPGSHKLPEMNFEDLGIAASYDHYKEYEDAIEAKIKEHRFIPEYGTVKKGQAIIWAANVLHGGAAQLDKSASRLSQVTHYYFEGAKYWRPGYSRRGRAYFEPQWIPNVNSPPTSDIRRLATKASNVLRRSLVR